MIAVKKANPVQYRGISSEADLANDEVAYSGPVTLLDDGRTPALVYVAASNTVRAMTQAEREAVPTQQVAARAAAAKALAVESISGTRDDARDLYAALRIILDDRNASAARFNAFKKAVFDNTTGAVKTAVGAVTDEPIYTEAQFRDAIIARVNA